MATKFYIIRNATNSNDQTQIMTQKKQAPRRIVTENCDAEIQVVQYGETGEEDIEEIRSIACVLQ